MEQRGGPKHLGIVDRELQAARGSARELGDATRMAACESGLQICKIGNGSECACGLVRLEDLLAWVGGEKRIPGRRYVDTLQEGASVRGDVLRHVRVDALSRTFA